MNELHVQNDEVLDIYSRINAIRKTSVNIVDYTDYEVNTKYHFYLFTFLCNDVNVHFTRGYKLPRVTKRNINKLAADLSLSEDAIVTHISYLGFMTCDEYLNGE